MGRSGNANRKCDEFIVFYIPTLNNGFTWIGPKMTTLTTTPLAPLLDRLFKEADAATSPAMAELSRDERERLMRSKTEYRAFYSKLSDFALPVSPKLGGLLYMLARAARACSIVEFGTSFGLSTLHLAAALRDNGGGRLITSEFEPTKLARAKASAA